MFTEEIETFRIRQKLTVLQFCSAAHLPVSQYRSYLYGEKQNLSVKDAVMLMASFPDELNINEMLRMIDKKELVLSPAFPSFRFSNDLGKNYERSEKVFRKFYIDSAFAYFSPLDAVKLLAAMISLCNKEEIWLPLTENMYYLMYSLRNLRKLKFTRFEPSEQTVLAHFDGSEHIELQSRDEIVITKNFGHVSFIQMNNVNFLETLNRKLREN